MNSQLNDTNNQLCEINSIKEYYIAEFFDGGIYWDKNSIINARFSGFYDLERSSSI